MFLGDSKGCLHMKTLSYQHMTSYYEYHKYKTVSRLSYPSNGKPYTWKDGIYIETGLRFACDKTFNDGMKWRSEGRLNIKMAYQYRNSYYKDKTVSLPSHLYNENTHLWKDGLFIETGPTLMERQNCVQWLWSKLC